MKYIMMETAEGKRLPFIFPESMVHAYVALMAKELIAIASKQPAKCVSAGFVAGIGLDIMTHGNSETLGLDSNPVDAAYIALGEAVAMMPPELMPGLMDKAKEHFKS